MYYDQPEPRPQSEIEQEELDKEQAAIERWEDNRQDETPIGMYYDSLGELEEE